MKNAFFDPENTSQKGIPDMSSQENFINNLIHQRFGPFVGVPCSFLKPLINCVINRNEVRYIAANNEGEAVAIAAGAYLAGRKPVVIFKTLA